MSLFPQILKALLHCFLAFSIIVQVLKPFWFRVFLYYFFFLFFRMLLDLFQVHYSKVICFALGYIPFLVLWNFWAFSNWKLFFLLLLKDFLKFFKVTIHHLIFSPSSFFFLYLTGIITLKLSLLNWSSNFLNIFSSIALFSRRYFMHLYSILSMLLLALLPIKVLRVTLLLIIMCCHLVSAKLWFHYFLWNLTVTVEIELW